MKPNIDDFTETEYRNLVRIAKKKWTFVAFTSCRRPGRICLWRHDIDLSVHRARRLAQIEVEEGVRATYFVLPHSPFYNVLEHEVRDLIREIASLGHDIGLHFDAGFYNGDALDQEGLQHKVSVEKNMIETLVGVPIVAFSYHDSDQVPGNLKVEDEQVLGMPNSHSSYIRENFGYCSDSNGYWRYRRLRDVLEEGKDERLQVLTHPGWWVPQPLTPRDRISRCIDGRAAKQHKKYDSALEKIGRTNLK